ncbi:helix-turn-helix domain-containing protein [Streptosporangium sp. NPDC000396]|uniref:helix-turn-helix domain-containing protein n=1 Tax=Streptosporangium sp. NPDC000396 TaxID=3366185 RepID=UPI0036812A97
MIDSENLEMAVTPRTYFGTELRKHRNKARLSQRQLCARINLSVSQLSMLENGHRAPNRPLAQAIDQALGLGTSLADLVDRLDRAANQVPDWFRPWVEVEQEAEVLRSWEPLIVPGLLQVEGYARALLSGEPGVTSERAEEHMTARLERQHILRRTTPPMFWVVIDEGVLHRTIGDPGVMKEQLTHLLEVGQSPWISIQVLPESARNTAGLLGGFLLAELPEANDTAYIESQGITGRVTERSGEVRALAFKYEVIRADALSRRESLNLIKEKMRRWTT